MILADVCVRRPVFATMLVGVLVVAGWFSYNSLTPGIDAQGRNAGCDGNNHPARCRTGRD